MEASRDVSMFCVDKTSGFEGNPMDVFHAKIGGLEYGPDEMPSLIGLYRGRYNVVFHPGEFLLFA